MERIYNPCKDCPDRYPACSDSCKKSKEYKAFFQAEKEYNKTSRNLMPASSGNTSVGWTRSIRAKHASRDRFRNHMKEK